MRLGARLIADDLAALGITVDCVPVLDLPVPGADNVIGDRAYGGDAARVARLGRAACDGLLDGGVLPVIKHIPAMVARGSTAIRLPVVVAAIRFCREPISRRFTRSPTMPWAMTAHIVFARSTALPATLSPT